LTETRKIYHKNKHNKLQWNTNTATCDHYNFM